MFHWKTKKRPCKSILTYGWWHCGSFSIHSRIVNSIITPYVYWVICEYINY